jgi:hypothetical protein
VLHSKFETDAQNHRLEGGGEVLRVYVLFWLQGVGGLVFGTSNYGREEDDG